MLYADINALPHVPIGKQYPTAVGDFNNLEMPVEESANMLIMTLAQARASGDATLVANHVRSHVDDYRP